MLCHSVNLYCLRRLPKRILIALTGTSNSCAIIAGSLPADRNSSTFDSGMRIAPANSSEVILLPAPVHAALSEPVFVILGYDRAFYEMAEFMRENETLAHARLLFVDECLRVPL